jgi:two-component system response regulator AtoC
VNLGGLPEGLIESELFGYEKGAFTGADNRRIGYFEAANGGTLFLDEIGELPSALQVKLLRSLQEKKIQRLGGTGVIPVNVRIIAATNRDLEKAVAEGSFREDLFYRINVIKAEMLPLRERPGDIVYLAELFLERLAEKGRTRVNEFSLPALEALAAYNFPGNVRELENMVERAVILAESTVLQPRDFNLPEKENSIPEQPEGTIRQMEIRLIENALLRNEGHREKTARELGITRKTLLNKMNTYGLIKKENQN